MTLPKHSFFSLPVELQLNIIQRLPPKDICTLSLFPDFSKLLHPTSPVWIALFKQLSSKLASNVNQSAHNSCSGIYSLELSRMLSFQELEFPRINWKRQCAILYCYFNSGRCSLCYTTTQKEKYDVWKIRLCEECEVRQLMLKAQIRGEFPLNDADINRLVPWKTNILTALGVIDVSYYLRHYTREYAINKFKGEEGLEAAMVSKKQRTEIRKVNKQKREKEKEGERKRTIIKSLAKMGITLKDLNVHIFPSYLANEVQEFILKPEKYLKEGRKKIKRRRGIQDTLDDISLHAPRFVRFRNLSKRLAENQDVKYESQLYGVDTSVDPVFVSFVNGEAGEEVDAIAKILIEKSKKHIQRHFQLHRLVSQALDGQPCAKKLLTMPSASLTLLSGRHTSSAIDLNSIKQKMREWIISDKVITSASGLQIIHSVKFHQQKESEQARRRFLFKAVQSESLKSQRKQLLDNALHSAGVYLTPSELEEYHIKETYHSFIHCAWNPDVEKAVGIIYNYQIACKNMESLDAEMRKYLFDHNNKSSLVSEEGIHCYDRVCYYWGSENRMMPPVISLRDPKYLQAAALYISRTEALYHGIHHSFHPNKFNENIATFESINLIQSFLKSVDYFYHSTNDSQQYLKEWEKSIHNEIENVVEVIVQLEAKRESREGIAREATTKHHLTELLFSPHIKRPLCLQKPKIPKRNFGDIRDDKLRYQKMITEWIYDLEGCPRLLSEIILEGVQILARMKRIAFVDSALHYDPRITCFFNSFSFRSELTGNMNPCQSVCRKAEFTTNNGASFTSDQLLHCGKYVSQAYRKFIFNKQIGVVEGELYPPITSSGINDIIVSISTYIKDVVEGKIAKSVVWKTFGEMNRWEW